MSGEAKEPAWPSRSAASPTHYDRARVGDVVLYGERLSNGAIEHPALITRIRTEEFLPTVNLKVFPDFGKIFDAPAVPHWRNGPFGSKHYWRDR